MRIAVISDIHSNLEAFQAVLDDIEGHGADRVICLGDVTGYNANPNECVEIVRQKSIDCIMGNHDAACSGLEEPWFFRSVAKSAAIWTADNLTEDNQQFLRQLPEQIQLNAISCGVHGSPMSRDEYIYDWLDASRHFQHLNKRKFRVCFFGHTHFPSLFSEHPSRIDVDYGQKVKLSTNTCHFINFGSVGQPRDSDP